MSVYNLSLIVQNLIPIKSLQTELRSLLDFVSSPSKTFVHTERGATIVMMALQSVNTQNGYNDIKWLPRLCDPRE
jgi:hypothetical protein